VLGRPRAVGHHDGFAVGWGECVPEIAGFEQVDVDAAGDDLDAFGEDLVAEVGFASGAVEENAEQEREVGEAGVELAAIFRAEVAMDGRGLEETENRDDEKPEEMANMLAGAAVFVHAPEAAPRVGPGGGAEHHLPVRLFEEQREETVHEACFYFRGAAGESADPRCAI